MITPVYNAEITLAETFESVRAQSIGFENIEYILADDASSDGSAAMIDAWAGEYPNVRALHLEKNSGSDGPPRNAALGLASAPYVMFLDADDLLSPDACRALYEAAERSGADVVSGGYHAFADDPEPGRDPDGEVFRYTGLAAGTHSLETLTKELCWTFCFSFSAKLYRRELIESSGAVFGADGCGADTVFLYLYIAACRSGEAIKDNIFECRIREGSLSHLGGEKPVIQAARSVLHTLELAGRLGLFERVSEILDLCDIVEFHTRWLIEEKGVAGEALERVCEEFEAFFKLSHERGFGIHSAYAKILQNDLARGDIGAAAYDIAALRELYYQRKTELEGIYSSRTWKIASAAQKLAFWKKQ